MTEKVRTFEDLTDVEQMRMAAEYVKETGGDVDEVLYAIEKPWKWEEEINKKLAEEKS